MREEISEFCSVVIRVTQWVGNADTDNDEVIQYTEHSTWLILRSHFSKVVQCWRSDGRQNGALAGHGANDTKTLVSAFFNCIGKIHWFSDRSVLVSYLFFPIEAASYRNTKMFQPNLYHHAIPRVANRVSMPTSVKFQTQKLIVFSAKRGSFAVNICSLLFLWFQNVIQSETTSCKFKRVFLNHQNFCELCHFQKDQLINTFQCNLGSQH